MSSIADHCGSASPANPVHLDTACAVGRALPRYGIVPAVVLAALSIAAPAGASGDRVEWQRVVDQHGSSVDVPVSLVRARPDPIGRCFASPDGRVTVELSSVTESRPGFLRNGPKGDMGLKRSDCDAWPPAYLLVREHVAASFCVKGRSVAYYLAQYASLGSKTLRVTYPAAQDSVG